jgi:hypothetical protein
METIGPVKRYRSTVNRNVKGGDTDDHTASSSADSHGPSAAGSTRVKAHRGYGIKNGNRCQGRFGDALKASNIDEFPWVQCRGRSNRKSGSEGSRESQGTTLRESFTGMTFT